MMELTDALAWAYTRSVKRGTRSLEDIPEEIRSRVAELLGQ